MYLWNDLLQNLIVNSTQVHFFEGNLAFDREWIFLKTVTNETKIALFVR